MEQVSYFINKLLFIDLLYCVRNADHTKKVCEKYTSKSKCPFPSARTLSLTFAGLYSRFEVAFEKLLRMFVCKFGMLVWNVRTYKRTFEVIFQKQIEIESKSFDKRQRF